MSVEIKAAATPQQIDDARTMFREYAAALGINLDFQGFEDELAQLPGKYASPHGVILLAYDDRKLAGCTAIRPLGEGVCELKRLFVRQAFTGRGLGDALMKRALAEAKRMGYRTLKLDSLKRLTAAARLYERFGFTPTAPYNRNDYEDVYYMEIDLFPLPPGEVGAQRRVRES